MSPFRVARNMLQTASSTAAAVASFPTWLNFVGPPALAQRPITN